MKKTLFVVAIAAMLVFAFAGSAFAVYASVGSGIQATGDGYITWAAATASPATGSNTNAGPWVQSVGPHGNYATNSLKCAVCHSVHDAAKDGIALTKVPANVVLTDPSSICAYCHGIGTTVTNKIVSVLQLGATDHGGGCAGGCHITSVHGAYGSDWKALNTRLLNARADAPLVSAMGTDTSGITGIAGGNGTGGPASDLMNIADPAQDGFGQAKAMATAYTCGGDSGGTCHGNSAFGVAKQGMVENTHANGYKTGHPVFQAATSTWSQTGTIFTGIGEGDPAGSGGGHPSGTIAYAPATGCAKCHDVTDDRRVGNPTAFPHNQITVGGNTSVLWMTNAGSVQKSDVTTVTDENDTVLDGVCLKCHRSITAGVTSGVGATY